MSIYNIIFFKVMCERCGCLDYHSNINYYEEESYAREAAENVYWRTGQGESGEEDYCYDCIADACDFVGIKWRDAVDEKGKLKIGILQWLRQNKPKEK